jgi:hypothetical protein
MVSMVKNTRVYTGSGLQRVKPYVQCVVELGMNREVLSNGALGRLIWTAG